MVIRMSPSLLTPGLLEVDLGLPQLVPDDPFSHRHVDLRPEGPVLQLLLPEHRLAYPGQFVLDGVLKGRI